MNSTGLSTAPEQPLGARITGAERVDNWVHHEGNVWKARVSNGIFGSYNPYTTRITGDWYYALEPVHTGDVYLNGKSMYEVMSLDGVLAPVVYESLLGSRIHRLYLVY